MSGYLYILKSEKHKRYYVGSSDDPERRLVTQHNNGFVKSTKSGIPWIIVFKQKYDSLANARKIEFKLKKYHSRVIIEKIINDGYCKITI